MDNNDKKQRRNTWLVITSIILVCIAVVCLVLFLTHGQTTVTGNYDGTDTQEKIVCESKITAYPLFTYDNSNGKSIKITGTFRNNELNTISLTYKLGYENFDEVSKSESVNHGALNTLSQDEGLGPDAYEATYSKLKDGLQLSLYASGSEIDNRALKYFMLEDLANKPYSQDKIMKVYANKGLNCKKSD